MQEANLENAMKCTVANLENARMCTVANLENAMKFILCDENDDYQKKYCEMQILKINIVKGMRLTTAFSLNTFIHKISLNLDNFDEKWENI